MLLGMVRISCLESLLCQVELLRKAWRAIFLPHATVGDFDMDCGFIRWASTSEKIACASECAAPARICAQRVLLMGSCRGFNHVFLFVSKADQPLRIKQHEAMPFPRGREKCEKHDRPRAFGV